MQTIETKKIEGSEILNLPPKQIGRSPWNRKHFDQAKLAQLHESIKEKGIQVPLKARKNPGYELKKNPDNSNSIWSKSAVPTRLYEVGTSTELSKRVVELNSVPYELIMGERRWMTGTGLKLDALPVILVEATDKDAIEQQAIENLQRDDLDPMSEAEKYAQLVDIEIAAGMAKKAAVEAVAKRLGKGLSTVYERLTLLDLQSKDAREACAMGRLPASHVALIVKLGDDRQAQDELTAAILKPQARVAAIEGEPGFDSKKPVMSYRDSLEAFEEVKQRSEQRKKHAQLQAAYMKKGYRVLTAAENKAMFKRDWDDEPEGFIDANDTNYDYYKKWKDLMGKHAPAPVLAITPRGKCVEVYPRKDCEEAIKKNGVKASRSPGRSDSEKEKDREHRDRLQRFGGMLGPVAEAAEKMESPEIWRYLYRKTVHGGNSDSVWLMVKRRWPETKRGDMYAAADKWMKTATGKQLRGAVIEILFAGYKPSTYSSSFGEHFQADCALFGVEAISWNVKVQTPGPAKEKPKQAVKAKPAPKAPAKAKAVKKKGEVKI